MLEFMRLIHQLGPNWVDYITKNPSKTIIESIHPSNRDLWDPHGRLGDSVIDIVCRSFNIHREELNLLEIEGEDSLLSFNFNCGGEWSISVRNSGTEPKTRVTIRTEDMTSRGEVLMARLMASIKPELYSGPKS